MKILSRRFVFSTRRKFTPRRKVKKRAAMLRKVDLVNSPTIRVTSLRRANVRKKSLKRTLHTRIIATRVIVLSLNALDRSSSLGSLSMANKEGHQRGLSLDFRSNILSTSDTGQFLIPGRLANESLSDLLSGCSYLARSLISFSSSESV